jgi:hypothetical protein
MTRELINQDSHVGHRNLHPKRWRELRYRDLESVDERFQQLAGNRRISQ